MKVQAGPPKYPETSAGGTASGADGNRGSAATAAAALLA